MLKNRIILFLLCSLMIETIVITAYCSNRKSIVGAWSKRERDDAENLTKLMFATWGGNLDAVRTAIDAGEDVNAQNRWGCNALMIAAESGRVPMLKLLYDKGARLNDKHSTGATALSIAADRGHQDAVRFLLENGADPHIRNNDRKTA